jgi:hypothetical protein
MCAAASGKSQASPLSSAPPSDELREFAAIVQHHFPGATVERRLYVLNTREKRTTHEWKDLFTGAVKVAGGGVEAVPGLEGGLMLLGLHTSDMSVDEMADLITYMESKAVELGVVLGGRDAAGDNPVADAA